MFDIIDINDWLRENIQDSNWTSSWYKIISPNFKFSAYVSGMSRLFPNDHHYFSFNNEEDLVLFKLVWC